MTFRRFAAALLLAITGGAALVAQPGSPAAEARTLRMIVVGTMDEARAIAARIAAGEDFASVARAESIDPSARDGGMLGRVALSTLRADVREAVQATQPGTTSAPVAVATGIALFQVVADRDPATAAAINPASLAAISATGSVKYVPDIGGLPEAEAMLRDFPKPAGWANDPGSICQVRQDSLAAGLQVFDDFFSDAAAALRRSRPPFELLQAHLGQAQLLAYQGSMASAITAYKQAYQLALASAPAAVPQVEEMLGVAYLHKAGMDNGVFRKGSDVCLLSGRPGRGYANTADVDKAIALFTKYLERRPDELEVRWLLNLAHMARGDWPDAVPARQRIPASAFASAEDVGRFRDVAPQAGLDVFASAGGVIVDDLSGSGKFDVLTSNFYSCGPMHYFGANGDGTWTERTPAAGLRDQVGGLNLIQADYNNDRCTDVLVLRGGWEVPQRKSLLRNDCNGTFTDVTIESGLAQPVTATQTAAWVDVDNDGWLDLFVANENAPAQLFMNDGTGKFTDRGQQAGVGRTTFAKGVAAGDYDNDGFVDLYVSNYDGANLLYRNNHDGTFTERAAAAGVPGAGRGFATWFFDYDNDGWLDLFVTSYFMSVDDTARTYLGLPHNAPTMKLYRNRGNGSFEDTTVRAGLDKVFMPMGANFGDIDNDGFLDMYLGMGTPSYGSIAPHVLLRNVDGKRFVDVTQSSGTGEVHKGHGVAFADLDNDGDEDIVAEIGGATPGDSHAMRVFENPGHGNDWVSLKLAGVKSNRGALGARITVTVENAGVRRTIDRQVSSGGSFGASPLEQHFGLGKDPRNIAIDVWWPTSNTRQHFGNVEKNQVLRIEELASTTTRIERTPITLGGAGRSQ
jgi:tetratricopeptide (TPR) repeat protein